MCIILCITASLSTFPEFDKLPQICLIIIIKEVDSLKLSTSAVRYQSISIVNYGCGIVVITVNLELCSMSEDIVTTLELTLK